MSKTSEATLTDFNLPVELEEFKGQGKTSEATKVPNPIEPYLTIPEADAKLAKLKADQTAAETQIAAALTIREEADKKLAVINQAKRELTTKMMLLECQGVQFYKITNKDEVHREFSYKDGWNILTDPFEADPTKSCCRGGLYITTGEHIFKFLSFGENLREVTLPLGKENFQIIKDESEDKWRCNMLYLAPGSKHSLYDVETYKMLAKRNPDLLCNSNLFDWTFNDSKARHITVYLIENDFLAPETYNYWLLNRTAEKDYEGIMSALLLNKKRMAVIPNTSLCRLAVSTFLTQKNVFNMILSKCSDLITINDVLDYALTVPDIPTIRQLIEHEQITLSVDQIVKLRTLAHSLVSSCYSYVNLLISLNIHVLDEMFDNKHFFRHIFDSEPETVKTLEYIMQNFATEHISATVLQRFCHKCIKSGNPQLETILATVPPTKLNYEQLIIKCCKHGRTNWRNTLVQRHLNDVDIEALFIGCVTYLDNLFLHILRQKNLTAFDTYKNSLLQLAYHRHDSKMINDLINFGADIPIYKTITMKQISESPITESIGSLIKLSMTNSENNFLTQIYAYSQSHHVRNSLLMTLLNLAKDSIFDDDKQNLLMKVIQESDTTFLKERLEHFRNWITTPKFLVKAVKGKNLSMVEFLIKHGCDVTHSDITTAAKYFGSDKIKKMINQAVQEQAQKKVQLQEEITEDTELDILSDTNLGSEPETKPDTNSESDPEALEILSDDSE